MDRDEWARLPVTKCFAQLANTLFKLIDKMETSEQATEFIGEVINGHISALFAFGLTVCVSDDYTVKETEEFLDRVMESINMAKEHTLESYKKQKEKK